MTNFCGLNVYIFFKTTIIHAFFLGDHFLEFSRVFLDFKQNSSSNSLFIFSAKLYHHYRSWFNLHHP